MTGFEPRPSVVVGNLSVNELMTVTLLLITIKIVPNISY